MNFFDRLNRVHSKPVTTDDEFPCNNAYCYSGYYKVLHPEKNFKCYLPEVMPFSRHPTVSSVPISKDELYGVCILSKDKANEICNYLKLNHNQFCDLPGFQSKSFFSLNWFKVIKAFILLSKEEKPRTAVIKYIDTWNLAFWQRAEDMWFYKRCAGIEPSIFEKLYFLAARGISVFTLKKEDPNLLLFFGLKHLQNEENLGIEGRIIQMYMNTYVNDMYVDTNDMLKHATKDLPAQYNEIHPFIIG